MRLNLVTAMAVPVIGLQEAKDHLRVTAATEDALIDSLMKSAEAWAEAFTGRALLTQSWDLTLESFPTEIEIPKPPLQSITSITYIDTAGASQTLASTVYQADTSSRMHPGRVKLAVDQVWPSTRSGEYAAVVVRFVAGYPYGVLPEPIRQAMLMVLSHLYDHREAIAHAQTMIEVPMGAHALAGLYRVWTF